MAALLFAAEPARLKDLRLTSSGLAAPQEAWVLKALDLLAVTETGRRVLADVGLDNPRRRSRFRELTGLGIEVRQAPLPDRAHTRLPSPILVLRAMEALRWIPAAPGSRGRYVILLNSDIVMTHPAALAPILAHELAHIKDYRDAPDARAILPASERRGNLTQVHVALELERLGLLPAPDPERLEEAKLLLAHRFLLNVWRGKPLPPKHYGANKAVQVKNFNNKNRSDPGLAAILRYIDLKKEMGEDVGAWDPLRTGLSPHVAKLDAEMRRQDRAVMARQGIFPSPVSGLIRDPAPPPPSPVKTDAAAEALRAEVYAARDALGDIARRACHAAGGATAADAAAFRRHYARVVQGPSLGGSPAGAILWARLDCVEDMLQAWLSAAPDPARLSDDDFKRAADGVIERVALKPVEPPQASAPAPAPEPVAAAAAEPPPPSPPEPPPEPDTKDRGMELKPAVDRVEKFKKGLR